MDAHLQQTKFTNVFNNTPSNYDIQFPFPLLS